MKRLFLTVFLSIGLSQQAAALSCVRSSIEGSFQTFNEASEEYVLVLGELNDKRNVFLGPETMGVGSNRSENFIATFNGHMATRSGFDRPIQINVAVRATCVASWCASIATDMQMITFIEKDNGGYALSEGPCGGTIFYKPTEMQIKNALQCLRGGVCVPKPR